MAVWSMDDACALYLGHIFNGRNLPARVLEPAIVPILGVAVQLILIDVIVGSQGRRIARRPRVWWHAHAEAKNTRAGGERRDDLADLAPPKDGGRSGPCRPRRGEEHRPRQAACQRNGLPQASSGPRRCTTSPRRWSLGVRYKSDSLLRSSSSISSIACKWRVAVVE